MPEKRFVAVSQRITLEKRLRRIGTARVKLEVLDFPNSKHLNLDNVERLKRLFCCGSGCVPEEFGNRIPAIVDKAQLLEALTISGVTSSALLSDVSEYPQLEFPPGSRLRCLRGRHRAKAAEAVLTSAEKCWVIDLYAADITEEAKQDLIEEYASERRPEDGEFYYKIREYQGIFGEKNPYFERRWWARLASTSNSTHKKKRLEQLLAHPEFAPAFDSFRHLRALYIGMRLSVVNKMISMGCLEELLFSLKHIRDFWYFVFDKDESAMHRLDEDSLKAVELTAPGACEAEALRLHDRIRSGEIFGAFDEQERINLWERLCSASTDSLVPSLFAYFENLKYLQVAASCMRRLVHLKKKETIRSALENKYSEPRNDTCLVQLSTSSFKEISTNGIDQFDLVYRQLWLFALREYQDVPAESKKKLAGPKERETDENVLFSFASLADKLGVSSREIDELLQRDPDREMARRFLTTARRPEDYEYNDLETCVTRIVNITSTARPTQGSESMYLSEVRGPSKPPTRCGISNYDDQPRDKKSMFLERMHAPIRNQETNITSFFVRRSIYFSYFGKDLGIPVHIPADAPEVDMYEGQNVYPNHSRTKSRQPRPQVGDRPEEIRQQDRLGVLREELQECEGRIVHFAEKEETQRAKLSQLQYQMEILEARVLAATNEESGLQERLKTLRRAEAEQIIRLDKLKGEEKERQSRIGQLEQTEHDLGEGIRLDLLATERQDRAVGFEPSGGEREFVTTETDLPLLEAEKERLQIAIDELSATVRQLTTTEAEGKEKVAILLIREKEHQSAVDSLAGKVREFRQTVNQLAGDEAEREKRIATLIAKEQERRSAVDRLGAKELELRQTVDQLAACLERLEAKVNHANANEGSAQSGVIVERESHPADSQLNASDKIQPSRDIDERRIRILFKVVNVRDQERSHEILVDPADSLEQVKQMAITYRQKGMFTLDNHGQLMNPRVCFDRVTSDGTNTIYLVRKLGNDRPKSKKRKWADDRSPVSYKNTNRSK